MNKFAGIVRRCVEDYDMIQEGERIAVGISGGKDSLVLLLALKKLQEYYPRHFELEAITIDMGFEGMDFSPVAKLCEKIDVPYTVVKTGFKQIVFDEREEKNPCSLCSKMRRGALCDAIKARGISKMALGHHFDDAVETFMMSLFYEGRIYCFEPVTYLDRSGVTQIRPMLYAREGTIRNLAERLELPVVKSTCPMDKTSSREDVKALIKRLSADYPDIKNRIFGSMQRLPLNGWAPIKPRRLRRKGQTE
ncbi:MAG: tRNA 2-thiocytidine biosynthesis protein TtcA [Oscillospiraceae bacterium]|nr:tRNA 2-thiocytidine biosynthesis protein TtcA [Oscillospiraceae bacterium]